MDTAVLSWLHDTITVELQDIIRNQAHTGRHAWLALEKQFLGNRDAQVYTSMLSSTSSPRGASLWRSTAAR
jgi:hypothetical protein